MIKILTILILLFSNISFADERNFNINIDNIDVKIRTPDGFFDARYVAPFMYEVFDMVMPKEMTVHAVLTAKKGIGERYMGLATVTDLDKIRLTQKMFNRVVRDNIRKKQFTIMNSRRSEDDKITRDMNRALASDYGSDTKLQITETTPLGVFIDNNKAIGFLSISSVERASSNFSEEIPMIGSTTMINIKDRLLYVYIYSTYKSSMDITWVKGKTKELVSLILMNNE
jgi:hypothetical protein